MTWKFGLMHFYTAWGRNLSHCPLAPLREMNMNEINAFLLMSQGNDDLSEDLSYRYQRYWKLAAGFKCSVSCLILCHGLLIFSKTHIHISKTHLYSHDVAGHHSPSCAGQSETIGKKEINMQSTLFFLLQVKLSSVRQIFGFLFSCRGNKM